MNQTNDDQRPSTPNNQTPALADEHSTSIADVKQLGLFAAIGSLSYVFWVVGGMEMIERLAYYGVKAVAALYVTDPAKTGGLGLTMREFAYVMTTWAFFQSLVPIFTGGLSDRYGYKETIFVSTVIKIIGYLIMAAFPTYYGFFAGAIVLATGTAVFKPGIQGTLVKATSRKNSSVAWGIFYQTVNIGGFLGPLVAGYMRKMEWRYVFLACAGIICLNFLMLLTYKEVGKEERLERQRLVKLGRVPRTNLAAESIRELIKPHVGLYLIIFSGFWFMLNSLWDVLPKHINDWVRTEDIIQTLFPTGKSENFIVNFVVITNEEGTAIQPEGMINLNSALIMLTCFLFAGISARMRATTSMIIGTLFASAALVASGHSTLGWVSVGAIALFSVGEMLSSPKFSEFIGNFAPHDKKAMYLGFSQIPLAVGWTLESFIAPTLYATYASKDKFSRELLAREVESGDISIPSIDTLESLADSDQVPQTASELSNMFSDNLSDFIAAIPKGEAFDWLVAISGREASAVQEYLYNTHNVAIVWDIMAVVGILTAIGIYLYGRMVLRMSKTQN